MLFLMVIKSKKHSSSELNVNANYSYSSSELQGLTTIAAECSIKGWYVVQARNILNVISGQILYYEDNCDDTKANSRMANTEEAVVTEIAKQAEFSLFPNPNKGVMTLLYNLADATEGKMQLVDVTGKLINEYNLQNNMGSVEINEEALGNGIYFYRSLVSDKIIKTDKIVIIK